MISFPKSRQTKPPPLADESASLRSQLQAMQIELEEMSRQYEDAIAHIAELEHAHAAAATHAAALEQANVRAALLVEELETSEQQQREQADALRKTTAELDEANTRLARTYRQVREAQALKERYLHQVKLELHRASAVQRMLLPEREPEIPGLELAYVYQPANETSGDWFGFDYDSAAESASLFIGDVTGHGFGPALITAGVFATLEAASTTSELDAARAWARGRPTELPGGVEQASALIHRYLRTKREPAAILALLDGVVRRMGEGELFMTFFAASLDLRSRKLSFANAGHCLPLLIGREDLAAEGRFTGRSLQARGNQLGAGAAGPEPREQRALQLAIDDLLLFYTDGLVESVDDKKRELGLRGVGSWLRELWHRPVAEIRDELRARVAEHRGARAEHDDLAFVLARVTDAGLTPSTRGRSTASRPPPPPAG